MVKENGMVMITEKEFEQMEKQFSRIEKEMEEQSLDYERRIELMQTAIMRLFHKGATSEDVRVSKIDFLEIYKKALNIMFDNMEKPNGDELPNDIYGHNFTVHWHGIYCDCGDGAVVANNLIPGIEGVTDEDPTEY